MVLVEEYGPEFGVNLTLEALRLSKSTWYYRRFCRHSYREKYALLEDPLMQIAQDHPSYGYRKVTAELRDMGWQINHKVVQKLQKQWDLPLVRNIRPSRQSPIREAIRQLGDRVNLVAGLRQIGVLQALYTDFTELPFDRGRQKAQLMPLIDHTSKLAVGWAVGLSCNTTLALDAWQRARAALDRLGVELAGIIVHQDQDPVYTGHAWLKQLRLKDGVRISYTLNGCKGNTFMESFNSHFKNENASVLWEKRTLLEVVQAVESRMHYYNDIRRHAALGNISPRSFLKKHGY